MNRPMCDIKDTGFDAGMDMLVDDSRGILDRHFPAPKIHQVVRHMIIINSVCFNVPIYYSPFSGYLVVTDGFVF